MKSKSFIITGAVVAAIAMCGPVTAFAASKKASASPSASPAASAAASPAASPSEKAPRAIPFRGTVASVDQSAKTFTIQGKEASRTFKVTDKTTVTKAGAAGTFADITENEKVTGSYWKQADGSLDCKSVKVAGGDMGAASTDKKSKKDAATSASPSPSASPKK